MALDLRDYSAERVGRLWTSEDHEYLLTALERIDQTCIAVWDQIRRETKDRPKRIGELLRLDELDTEQ
jgi:hypothetical protein